MLLFIDVLYFMKRNFVSVLFKQFLGILKPLIIMDSIVGFKSLVMDGQMSLKDEVREGKPLKLQIINYKYYWKKTGGVLVV